MSQRQGGAVNTTTFVAFLVFEMDKYFGVIFFIAWIILYIIKMNLAPFPIWRIFGEPGIELTTFIAHMIKISQGKSALRGGGGMKSLVCLICLLIEVAGVLFLLFWQALVSSYDYALCGLELLFCLIQFVGILLLCLDR
ncbi:hypothetical protein BLNAU_10435 [Blattamonas nauphoetae]|uniref:Transmembrane protein n=1 Tax=Blattamonas nauphoetae TaxID=2049346 RepID=A0ABQ9XS04_9EUKA|nr:hypothetical protein BLNAU_10435 [Blattamonas nauphoetae]